MKIIRKSNFDYEDARGDQRVVARDIASKRAAEIMCDALNKDNGEYGEDFFEVVVDDYVLPKPWEP